MRKHIDPPNKRSQDFRRSMMALGIWCPECGSPNTGDPGAATYCTTVCKDCGHRWDREKHKHDTVPHHYTLYPECAVADAIDLFSHELQAKKSLCGKCGTRFFLTWDSTVLQNFCPFCGDEWVDGDLQEKKNDDANA